MNIAICDDELIQIAQIESLLHSYRNEKRPDLRWSVFQTGFSLLTAIESGQNFDAVFLDIYMQDMNGMDVAKTIRKTNATIKILFLTSSPDFAVESYQVEASDYILKPIAREAFFASLDRLSEKLSIKGDNSLVVRDSSSGVSKIPHTQLAYIEASGRNGIVYRSDHTSIKTTLSFSAVLEQLQEYDNFIHRSYLVNLNYVYRITKNEVFLTNGTVLPLSRNQQKTVLNRFIDFSFKGDEA